MELRKKVEKLQKSVVGTLGHTMLDVSLKGEEALNEELRLELMKAGVMMMYDTCDILCDAAEQLDKIDKVLKEIEAIRKKLEKMEEEEKVLVKFETEEKEDKKTE